MSNPSHIRDILKEKKFNKSNVSNDNVDNENNNFSTNVNNVVRKDVNDNNVNKNNSNNVTNVENLTREELLELLNKKFIDEKEKRKWIVEELIGKLNDSSNANYYKSIAERYPAELLLECLSITQDADKRGVIKSTLAKYFVGVLKRRDKQIEEK